MPSSLSDRYGIGQGLCAQWRRRIRCRRRAGCAPDRSRARQAGLRHHGEPLAPAPWSAWRRLRPPRAWCSRPVRLCCETPSVVGGIWPASRARRIRCPARTAPPRNAARRRWSTLPAALTAARAPTVRPPRVCALAEPMPPLRLTVVAPSPAPRCRARNRRSRFAPPRSRARDRADSGPSSCRRRDSRSNRIAPGTIGTRALRTWKPRPCSRSQACTPEAASSPKAEPPDSTMASMPSTVCAGSSSAVSRVPGPAAAHVDARRPPAGRTRWR